MLHKLARLFISAILIAGIGYCPTISADNQTPTISPIFFEDSLPFRIRLEQADFKLPVGVQSYVTAAYNNKWLIITGRISGLHGFGAPATNFPTSQQNTNVIVIDPIKKKTYIRSLLDPDSGLTQEQIDLLSVTAAQGYQSGKTLYITGGYGLNSTTGNLDTKNALTAINVPGLIRWVVNPRSGETAAKYIRHIFDDIFKITGGYMNRIGKNSTLLMMGQEFDGFYADPLPPTTFQEYSRQIRRFRIHDDGIHLSFTPESSFPFLPDPNFRRRDINIVPVIRKTCKKLEQGFVALSGVFTPTNGVWTVPVEITANGEASMPDPNLPSTFKQGMNNYDCATFGLFSEKTGNMYTILLGGISFGFFQETPFGLIFSTDSEIPFINQTTTIQIDKQGNYTQYFMQSGGYPFIPSKTINAGNPLLFGAEAEAFLLKHIPKYRNDVIKLDSIKKETLIGYVVGGIKSTVPNTTSQADSSPSKYIFKIILEPISHHCH